MPQNKKPKKGLTKRTSGKGPVRMTGAQKRAKDLANRKKIQERQKRLRANKAKKRAPKEGPGKLGKELVSSGKAKKTFKKVIRKAVKSVKGPAKRGVDKVSSSKPTASTLRNQARSTMKKNPKVKKPTATPRKIKEKVTKRGRKRKVKY